MAAMPVLLLVACLALGSHAAALAEREAQNPISRVAVLMQNMAKKVEADGKMEQELFEKYECWYKTVVGTKKTTNSVAHARIEALETYIRDIEGGGLEFTGERVTLEKEINGLTNEIEKGENMRKGENEEYTAAKDEMEKAISALKKAIEVLGDATKDSALVQRDAVVALSDDLKDVIALGRNFLPKAQTSLLGIALARAHRGPKAWSSLIQQPAHSMKYKAGSTKIQEILADMLDTFKDNLEDAEKMETQKKESFDKLYSVKRSQLKTADTALAAGTGEADRRNLMKQEASQEMKMLQEQVTRDEEFVRQADEAYNAKVEEWGERCRLRQGEIAAITEAASVLTSDEARDTSSKSMASQGYLLLQEGHVSNSDGCLLRRAEKVGDMLRKTAIARGDLRLSMLALQLHGQHSHGSGMRGHFDAVTKSIEEMVSDLHRENDKDLEEKERCEKDRMDNTNVAKKTSQQIDDVTALISRKNTKVVEFNQKIAAKQVMIKNMKLQIKNAEVQRSQEKSAFEANKADDEAAKSLVDKSMDVLKKFYEDNGLSFAQVGVGHRHKWSLSQRQHQPIAGGEAPPPPPQTFSEPYGGAKGESDGIQAIMDMIKDDIDKDIREATAQEEKEQGLCDSFVSDTNDIIDDISDQISALETQVGDFEETISISKSKRGDKKVQLEDTMGFLRTIAPGCDFIAVNFQTRKDERAAEVDGLLNAKAALSGGSLKGVKPALMQADDEC